VNRFDPNGLGLIKAIKRFFKKLFHAFVHAATQGAISFITTGNIHTAWGTAVSTFFSDLGVQNRGYWHGQIATAPTFPTSGVTLSQIFQGSILEGAFPGPNAYWRFIQPFNPQYSTPNLPAITNALRKCLRKVFQTIAREPAVELLDFAPSSEGSGGYARVKITDAATGGRTGVFKIRNNVTSYSYRTVPRDVRKRGHALGWTRLNAPLVNFTVSDRDNHDAFDPRLQHMVGGYISVQIHELGNSIYGLSGVPAYYDYVTEYKGTIDSDDGYQLERCVRAELQQHGY
jgi:hypothetical protein